MKRYVFLTVFVLTGFVSVLARADDSGSRLKFGIVTGVNAAGCTKFESLYDPFQWSYVTPEIEEDYRYGAAAGVFASFRLAKSVYLEPAVLYSQKGCKRKYTMQTVGKAGMNQTEYKAEFDTTVKLDYIEIPLISKFIFNSHPTARAFITVGPSLGINTAAKTDYDVKYTITESIVNGPVLFTADSTFTLMHDIKDFVKTTNFSVAVGIGLNVTAGRGNLSFEVRYMHGFTIIPDPDGLVELPGGEYLYFDEATHRSLSFLVGYAYPLFG